MPEDVSSPNDITFFGRKISEIPCFRNSLLYGISGSLGVGLVAFLFTSRPLISTHIGFAGFNVITIGYWVVCRYNYSKQLKIAEMIKDAISSHTIEEIVLNSAATAEDVVTVSNKNSAK